MSHRTSSNFPGKLCLHRERWQLSVWRTGALATLMLFVGCASGDFGRVKPSLVSEDMHAWVGKESPNRKGKPPSQFPLADAERRLRDLAYPLIEPPYDRQRWYSVLAEYGLIGAANYPYPDRSAYAGRLMETAVRSQNARYFKLIEDVRNDVARIDSFFAVARYVVDMDRKRGQTLVRFAASNVEAQGDARARIAENSAVIDWVKGSLCARAASYQLALEQLAVVAPSPMAVEVERSLSLMRSRLAAHDSVLGQNASGASSCFIDAMAQTVSK